MGAARKKERPLYVVLENETDDFIDAGYYKTHQEWFVQDRLNPERYRIVRYVPATRKTTK